MTRHPRLTVENPRLSEEKFGMVCREGSRPTVAKRFMVTFPMTERVLGDLRSTH